MKRWLARFRRRLRKKKTSQNGVKQQRYDAAQTSNLASEAHRGHGALEIVARQAAHGIPNDCALCALKNVTVDESITLSAAFEIANQLQAALDDEDLSRGTTAAIRHCDATGNFSGKVLVQLALKYGYGAYRISAERDGECGHARALVETLCGLANSRLCGAVWRLGSVAGAAAASGHWVGASHVPSLTNWLEHQWAIKDSLTSGAATITTTEAILEKLDAAERARADFYVIVNLS